MASKDAAGTVMRYVRANIKHGYDTVCVDVLPCEIAVLKQIHGEDSVSVTNEDVGETLVTHNAATQYAQLKAKYLPKEGDDPVARAYPEGPAGLKDFVNEGAASEEDERGVTKVRRPRVG